MAKPDVELTHPDDIISTAQVIYDFLLTQNKATKDEIRTYCKAAGIDTALYNKGFGALDRQLNIITEGTNDEGKKVWELKEWARRLEKFSDAREVAENASGKTPKADAYTDFFEVRGTLELHSPSLSGCPVPNDPATRVFMRSANNIILLSGYYRSMFEQACYKAFAPKIGSARYRIQWAEQYLSDTLVSIVLRPVPPSHKGGAGQGITSCEALAPGVKVPFHAIVPGSHISPAEFETILRLAGEWVGFSPAASKLGFGKFTVRIAEDLTL